MGKRPRVQAFEAHAAAVFGPGFGTHSRLGAIHRIVNRHRAVNPLYGREDQRSDVSWKGHMRRAPGSANAYTPLSLLIYAPDEQHRPYEYKAPTRRVGRLMEKLGTAYQEALASAQNEEERLRALAFFNVWTTIIQPFKDGNGLALAGFNGIALARMGYRMPPRP